MFSSSYALYVLLFNSKLCFNLVSGFNIIKFLGVNESVSINRRGVLKGGTSAPGPVSACHCTLEEIMGLF